LGNEYEIGVNHRSFWFERKTHMDWEKGVPGAMGRLTMAVYSSGFDNI
jgi:hypothetical protein